MNCNRRISLKFMKLFRTRKSISINDRYALAAVRHEDQGSQGYGWNNFHAGPVWSYMRKWWWTSENQGIAALIKTLILGDSILEFIRNETVLNAYSWGKCHICSTYYVRDSIIKCFRSWYKYILLSQRNRFWVNDTISLVRRCCQTVFKSPICNN